MEFVDFGTGREYHINYRKLRITRITDLRESHKLLVEAYLRISYNQRINLRCFIHYSAIGNEARSKSNIALIATHDAAINLIDTIILKLPVGVPSEELSIFERNMMNAICHTLVVANPTLSANDIRTAPPALIALMKLMEKDGYHDLTIPLNDIVQKVGGNNVDVEMDLWSGRPFVSIRSIDDVNMVTASAELVSLFYTVSTRPRFTEADIADDYEYSDSIVDYY